MQQPHEALLKRNPAFAELYPSLQSRVEQLLDLKVHAAERLEVQRLTRQWHKLNILREEVQVVLADDRYKPLSESLAHYLAESQFPSRYEKDLRSLGIPATHTFISTPTNLDEQLRILSDIVAASIDEKLSLLRKLQALSNHAGDDLAATHGAREESIAEVEAANAALARDLSLGVAQLYSVAEEAVTHHANYVEQVKHGSVEKFTASSLDYYDAATKALLERCVRMERGLAESLYTPETQRALEDRARDVKRTLPRVQERLECVNREIERREAMKTEEYVFAIKEYQRLKEDIQQAQEDVDKLMHHKAVR